MGSRKGMHPLEFRILLILLDEATHGYGVLKALEADPEGPDIPYPANLYRRIRDLRDRGWIRETPPPDEAPDDDRRRHYYEVTKEGRTEAAAEARRMNSLLDRARAVELLG